MLLVELQHPLPDAGRVVPQFFDHVPRYVLPHRGRKLRLAIERVIEVEKEALFFLAESVLGPSWRSGLMYSP